MIRIVLTTLLLSSSFLWSQTYNPYESKNYGKYKDRITVEEGKPILLEINDELTVSAHLKFLPLMTSPTKLNIVSNQCNERQDASCTIHPRFQYLIIFFKWYKHPDASKVGKIIKVENTRTDSNEKYSYLMHAIGTISHHNKNNLYNKTLLEKSAILDYLDINASTILQCNNTDWLNVSSRTGVIRQITYSSPTQFNREHIDHLINPFDMTLIDEIITSYTNTRYRISNNDIHLSVAEDLDETAIFSTLPDRPESSMDVEFKIKKTFESNHYNYPYCSVFAGAQKEIDSSYDYVSYYNSNEELKNIYNISTGYVDGLKINDSKSIPLTYENTSQIIKNMFINPDNVFDSILRNFFEYREGKLL